MKNILRLVIIGLIVSCLGSGLLGCSSQKAALNSRSASENIAQKDSNTVAAKPQIKDINVKTTQGQNQVDTQIDKNMQALDNSLDELDKSLGNL